MKEREKRRRRNVDEKGGRRGKRKGEIRKGRRENKRMVMEGEGGENNEE